MAEPNTLTTPQTDALAKLAEIPPAGSEERDFWLEAALQHGFEKLSGTERAYFADQDEVLTLMSEARKQGQRDALAVILPVYGSKRRPSYGEACLGVDGMGANLRLSDGRLELVFKDEELEFINEEGRDLYVARLAGSEVIALRQWLIDYLPVSEAEISAAETPPPDDCALIAEALEARAEHMSPVAAHICRRLAAVLREPGFGEVRNGW